MAAQPREALAVIERQAARVRAPIRIAGEDWTATEERGRLVYQDDAGLIDLPAPKLYGRHQFENAGLAIAALRARRRAPLARCAAARGLRGRRQGGMAGPHAAAVAAASSPRWCRKAASCGSTAATIRTAAASSPARSPISRSGCRGRWCSSSACWPTRTPKDFSKNFTGLARRIVTVPIPQQENALPAAALAAAARAIGLPAQESPDLETALAAIGRFELDQPPRILITGSLYLAGAALAAQRHAAGVSALLVPCTATEPTVSSPGLSRSISISGALRVPTSDARLAAEQEPR